MRFLAGLVLVLVLTLTVGLAILNAVANATDTFAHAELNRAEADKARQVGQSAVMNAETAARRENNRHTETMEWLKNDAVRADAVHLEAVGHNAMDVAEAGVLNAKKAFIYLIDAFVGSWMLILAVLAVGGVVVVWWPVFKRKSVTDVQRGDWR